MNNQARPMTPSPAPKKNNNGAAMAAGIGGVAGIGAGVLGGVAVANAYDNIDEPVEILSAHQEIIENNNVSDTYVEHVHTEEYHHHHHHAHAHHHADSMGMDDDPVEVEVVGYERIDDGTGGQMDVAVVDVDGNGLLIIDEDIDGYADWMAGDFNSDGQLQQDEFIDVRGQGISMEPLQEASNFVAPDPEPIMPEPDPYVADADSDIPDYMNDADVDSFMV